MPRGRLIARAARSGPSPRSRLLRPNLVKPPLPLPAHQAQNSPKRENAAENGQNGKGHRMERWGSIKCYRLLKAGRLRQEEGEMRAQRGLQ